MGCIFQVEENSNTEFIFKKNIQKSTDQKSVLFLIITLNYEIGFSGSLRFTREDEQVSFIRAVSCKLLAIGFVIPPLPVSHKGYKICQI
ncbi:hypothetical protein A2996_00745 [Candidatus Campbellbacteria bacterium RIFCSPLOWO2_01_FULL_34_15]|uniref:Uncharacterized protein n=2 Tax=Candidatus Campbelliibacteriota TaxID=1752727 RepID=A0A1F5ENB2_9BACT|nr:MAG: hypothetical protein A2811_02475 [Candidatus Campbellbacteria bacterium RIFCSPHIGHO2_01_FULL_34_10]OGD68899.1 MAG: hypothetical protein A2996_00745 [Candidatus Campbellbacteria bacterium RIFCSPLOWO2_01_FULL_34_15]